MKRKSKRILIGSLATLLILGGASAVIGVASDGFKNWDTSTWFQDEFKDVKIESKTVAHDGTKKELDIVVPEGATYVATIKKGEETVTECIEIGVYDYEVVVTIGEKTKSYKAQLNIVENSEVSINAINNIKKVKVDETTYKLNATITPDHATKKDLNWSIAFKNPSSSWANGKNLNEYVTMTSDQNTATIKMLKRFSEQIIVTAAATDYTGVSASCTVDCKKILLSSDIKAKTDSIEITPFIKGGSPEYGDGIIIDIGEIIEENLSTIESGLGIEFSSYFNETIVLSEGTIEYDKATKFSYTLETNSDCNMSEDFINLCNDFFTFNSGESHFSWTGVKIEDEPGRLDVVDNFLTEIGESSHTAVYQYKIHTTLENGVSKDFAIYFTNTNHLVREINLSESNIVF